jgi:hypothetical protein
MIKNKMLKLVGRILSFRISSGNLAENPANICTISSGKQPEGENPQSIF